MNSKKAITLLVLLSMLLAMVPMSFGATEIALDALAVDKGKKGDTIEVTGTGVVAGKNVKLYWDLVQAWDGEGGLLNTTKAKSSGNFLVWFDVPEAVVGDHWIWVEDTQTGLTDKAYFQVVPKVTLSASSGLKTDKVTVKGYGYNGDKDVAIWFNDTITDYTHNVAGTAVIDGDGTTKDFDGTFNKAVLPGTVWFWYGAGNYTMKDDGLGNIVEDAGVPGDVSGTINYVTGEWEISITTAPIAAEDYVASYWYVKDVADAVKLFTTSASTNGVGSFTKEVTIPDYDAGALPAWYNITAMDANGTMEIKGFRLGPVITLNKDSGPTGTVVEISGKGFEYKGDVTDIVITEDGVHEWFCYNTTWGKVNTKGQFKVQFVVPSVPDASDDWYIKVTTNNSETAKADFEVTGVAAIELTPEYGGVNDLIGIHGYNFSMISNTEVVVNLTQAGSTDKFAKNFKTDSSGEFSGTFRVPAAAAGVWAVNATVEDHQVNATKNFRVGIVIALIAPESGAQGAKVTLSGVGFTDTGDWNATMDDELLADGTADGDGVITSTFYIPNIAPGTYTVYVLDIESEITVTTEFTITDVTYLELDPISAANGYNITISGWHYSEDDGRTYTYVLYNDTDEWDISADINPQRIEEDGNLTAYWEVYDEDTLDLGTYWLNVTDDNDLFAQIQMDIVDAVVSVAPKKSVYQIGDTIAFSITSTFPQNGAYFKIYDPQSNLYWQSDAINTWIKVGYERVVPFYAQTSGQNPMILVSDAPLGTWTWKMYDVDDEVMETGTFTVSAAAADVVAGQVEDLANQITDLASQLSDVTGEFADVKSDIADVAAVAQQAVTAAQQAAQAVQTVAQTANQANTAAQNAADAANAAKDAANSLTTLVYGAIGAALVAALAAIVSLMQISRRIAG